MIKLKLSAKKITIFLFIIIAFIISLWLRGFKQIRGADTTTYIAMFDPLISTTIPYLKYYLLMFFGTNSHGFGALNILISLITKNQYLYLFITTFLIILLLFYSFSIFFKDKEKKLYISSIVFLLSSSTFYFYSINIIRQGLMISFFILSLYFFLTNSKKKFYISFFLGISFHISIFLIIPALIVYKYGPRIKFPIIYIIPAFFISLALQPKLISKIFYVLNSPSIGGKFLFYATSTINSINILIKIAIIFIILSLLHAVYRYSKDFLFTELYYITCLIFASGMIFFNMSGILNRFLLVVSILLPILFCRAIYTFRRKTEYFLIGLILSSIYFLVILNHPSVKENLEVQNVEYDRK